LFHPTKQAKPVYQPLVLGILQGAIERLAVELERHPTTGKNIYKKSRAILMLAKIINIKENRSDMHRLNLLEPFLRT